MINSVKLIKVSLMSPKKFIVCVVFISVCNYICKAYMNSTSNELLYVVSVTYKYSYHP